jgi:hypothetical protein
MVKNTRVSIIEASHFTPGTAYVAAKRYQMDDRAPYIWKTTDFGHTWKKIVTGIKSDDYVHVIREDSTTPGLLYAGTEHGVYISWNDGDNWQPLKLNLPDVQVADIAVTDKDLVLGTHGRSIYVLDDIAPLRQYKADIANAGLYLYQPYYAVRNVQEAAFQYYLKDTANPLTVDILDASGNLVQSFKGITHKSTADSLTEAREEEEFGYGKRQQAPSIKPGLNTFTWDLRYPAPALFPGMILWGASPLHGPVAPPGRYQVRFTAGAKTETRNFEIKLDPRLKEVSVKDVTEQFQLAMQIRNATDKANRAVIRIRSVKQNIKPTNANKQLLAKLTRIEEDLYQTKNQSGQDPLNFPIKLNNRLAALERSVETGDAKPTASSYTVFSELSTRLDQLLTELNTLLQNKKTTNSLDNTPLQ